MRFLLPFVILLSTAPLFAAHLDIIKEEDSRAVDSRLLKKRARSDDLSERLAALRAMGRIQSRKYLANLLKALKDDDTEARMEAVFALGQLGLGDGLTKKDRNRAAASLRALIRRESEDREHPSPRTTAIEALGKIGGKDPETFLRSFLSHDLPTVRSEAALALFRLRYFEHIPDYSTATLNALIGIFRDEVADVRWKGVYAFNRWPEPRATHALIQAASDPDILARLFAIRTLGRLGPESPTAVFVKALLDTDQFVRTEAVRALGKTKRADLLTRKILRDSSPHVLAAAADALAATEDPDLAKRLDGPRSSDSPLAQGQALLALGKLKKAGALKALTKASRNPHWWIKSRAYLAMQGIPGTDEILTAGAKDPDVRVALEALTALSRSTETFVLGLLDEILRDPASPMEMRGTAADLAGEKQSLALLDALHVALTNSLGRGFAEIRDSIIGASKKIFAAHPDYERRYSFDAQAAAPLPSQFIGVSLSESSIILTTEKGEIEIALAVHDAPQHAASILKNVADKVYDGTIWHRVVSGFVIQGGDPRGSGWGDAGVTLRDEINPLRYRRGTVGMPKAGKDTGGSQIFIMHLPAPHLDGRYTVFGTVTRGMEVVDAIEPGDRILTARVK